MGQYLQDSYSNHDHMSLGWKIYLHRGHVGYKSQPIRSKTHVLNQGPKQRSPSNRSVVSLAVKTLFQMPTMHIDLLPNRCLTRQTMGGLRGGSWIWIPTTHRRDLDWIPGSWHWLVWFCHCRHLWRENLMESHLSLVYLSLFQMHKYYQQTNQQTNKKHATAMTSRFKGGSRDFPSTLLIFKLCLFW